MGELERLELINVSFNQLSSFPSSILKLSKLQSLAAAYNQISDFPFDALDEDSKLQDIFLSSNPLKTISPNIGVLSDLIELFLSNINIDSVPGT